MYNNVLMKKIGKRRESGKSAHKNTGRGQRIGSLKAAGDGLHGYVPDMYRPIKKPVTLRLDADVVAWFKTRGRGYQTRINSALRRLMLAEKKAAAKK